MWLAETKAGIGTVSKVINMIYRLVKFERLVVGALCDCDLLLFEMEIGMETPWDRIEVEEGRKTIGAVPERLQLASLEVART